MPCNAKQNLGAQQKASAAMKKTMHCLLFVSLHAYFVGCLWPLLSVKSPQFAVLGSPCPRRLCALPYTSDLSARDNPRSNRFNAPLGCDFTTALYRADFVISAQSEHCARTDHVAAL